MEIFECGALFEQIQLQQIFSDGKTIVDATAVENLQQIVEKFNTEKDKPDFDLKRFVNAHFILSNDASIPFSGKTILSEHINSLWPLLTREDRAGQGNSTLINLPNKYIVPGGRFREIYYWDSYFTMLGLSHSGHIDLIENMVDNFAFLIKTIGYIPNGNRTYYFGRSQPPFFALMVELVCNSNKDINPKKYIDFVAQEYKWWMLGSNELSNENISNAHVVRMPCGTILNRYFDVNNNPRPESYKEDIELASENIGKKTIYKHIRAAAESGWDFSSRWFADNNSFNTIHTTDLIPIDLNCLLYYVETLLSKWYQQLGEAASAQQYQIKSMHRKNAIQKYCWNEQAGFFYDYDFMQHSQKTNQTLAACFPLFVNMAKTNQAESVASVLHKHFLKAGGLVTTLQHTGQQWDAPNGWAPLQWIGIKGLMNYGMYSFALEIAKRWNKLNENVFCRTGKMMEKYNVENLDLKGGGGEYPTQDGFGWTNGVFLQIQQLIKNK